MLRRWPMLWRRANSLNVSLRTSLPRQIKLSTQLRKQITYSLILNIKAHFVGAQHLQRLSIISIQVYLIDKNNNSHLGQVLLVSHIAWARRGTYNTILHNYLNRRWALHFQNVMTRYLTLYFPPPPTWMTKREFLLTISIQYQAKKRWE